MAYEIGTGSASSGTTTANTLAATGIASLSGNTLPMLDSDTLILTDSPVTYNANMNQIKSSGASIHAGTNSFYAGDNTKIHATNGFLGLELFGDQFIAPVVSVSANNSAILHPVFEDQTTVTYGGIDSAGDDPTGYSLSATETEMIMGLNVYAEETGYLRCRIYSGDDNTGDLLFDTITHITTTGYNDLTFDPFQLDNGDNVYLYFSGVSIGIDSDSIPYMVFTRLAYSTSSMMEVSAGDGIEVSDDAVISAILGSGLQFDDDSKIELFVDTDSGLAVGTDGLGVQVTTQFDFDDDGNLILVPENISVLDFADVSQLETLGLLGQFDETAVVTDFQDYSAGNWAKYIPTTSGTDFTLGTLALTDGDILWCYATPEETVDEVTTAVTLTDDNFATYFQVIDDTVFAVDPDANYTMLQGDSTGAKTWTATPSLSGLTLIDGDVTDTSVFALDDDSAWSLTNTGDFAIYGGSTELMLFDESAGAINSVSIIPFDDITSNLGSADNAFNSVITDSILFNSGGTSYGEAIANTDDSILYLFSENGFDLQVGRGSESDDQVFSDSKITFNKLVKFASYADASGVVLTGTSNSTQYYLQIDDSDSDDPQLQMVEI